MSALLPLASDREVDRLVRLAHEHLGLDAVYVAEIVDGTQVCRWVAGDAQRFGLTVGSCPGDSGAYGDLMVEGVLPNVVTHSARHPALRTAFGTGVGACVGVPLHLPGGELYGMLCALSCAPQPDLNVRDVRFLSLVAASVVGGLASERALHQQRERIRAVIDTRDLRIALQPIVDLASGSCMSLEALSRFPSPLGPPDVVFRAAEQAGLQLELEQLAVQQAVAMLPLLSSEQSLAINLSPAAAVGLMPLLPRGSHLHQLVVEITEHAVVESYARIRQSLAPLRRRGLRLAIDDAGAGYASLRHIIELRPDIIKIDRSLVAGIDRDAGRRSALTTFTLLALDIGASLIAEGVETRAELATVTALGVDAAQGYLLGRPSSSPRRISDWTNGRSMLAAVA